MTVCAIQPPVPGACPPEQFRCDREQAHAVREYVRARCTSGGRGDLAEEAAIVAGELFANAVSAQLCQGVTTAISVQCLAQGGLVTVDVYDHAAGVPQRGFPGALSESGRGLGIVHALTGGQWGWTPTGYGGKCVVAMIGG